MVDCQWCCVRPAITRSHHQTGTRGRFVPSLPSEICQVPVDQTTNGWPCHDQPSSNPNLDGSKYANERHFTKR